MKIGDYVRTLNGKIWIIKSQQAISGHKKDIILSSPIIIDLIEVGDYVNGSKVIDIAPAPEKALYTEDINQKGALIPITNNKIKSVLTKEQFESMEYKI